jgi:hypothetical protein
VSDLDRLLAQVEELKRLANRRDESWMNNMSNEELLALSQKVRRVADGLSGLQSRLQGSVPQNPMKPLFRKQGASWSAPRPPAGSPRAPARPAAAPDPSNPMFRRQGPSWQPPGPPAARPPVSSQPAGAPDLSNPIRRRQRSQG